jgi:hypothetical protein
MRKLQTLFAAFAVAGLTACGTKDAPGPLEPTGPTGRVRFVNLINDAARVPVNPILEGLPWGAGVGYGQSTPAVQPAPATASYSPIYVGSRTLLLKKTADTTVTIATIPLTIAENQDMTVYATGGAAGAAPTVTITTDDNSVPAAGQVRFRVANMSAAAGAVDVFVTAANADLSAAPPTFTNVAVRSASAYVALPAASYQIRVVPAGTAAGARAGAVSLNIAAATYAAGTVRTIVIEDRAAGGAPLAGTVLSDR